MSPQFVDFDADGVLDIVTATYDGSPHLALGKDDGTFEWPQRLTDAAGNRILLGQFWDYIEEDWKGIDGDNSHCVSAVAFDWDDDGDFDLLLGSKDATDGKLFLQRNEGEVSHPKFTGTSERIDAGGKPLSIPGGITAPRLVDWNDDGLTDIVCGSFGGGVYLLLNDGELGDPSFEAPVSLIAQDGQPADGQHAPNSGVYADPVDVDGDGDLDLLVGGYAEWTPEVKPLTDKQQADIASMEAQVASLQGEIQQLLEAAAEGKSGDEAQAAMNKVFESEEFKKRQELSMEIYSKVLELRPGPKREAGVWLYEQH